MILMSYQYCFSYNQKLRIIQKIKQCSNIKNKKKLCLFKILTNVYEISCFILKKKQQFGYLSNFDLKNEKYYENCKQAKVELQKVFKQHKFIKNYKYFNRMRVISKNIFTNFDCSTKKTNSQKKIKATIIGQIGNGKTSFINKMCNTQFQAGNSKRSLTKDITYSDAAQFQQGKFRLYDTPGTDSKSDGRQNAQLIRATLECVPLNLVLIQAKYSSRIEDFTLHQLRRLLKIFKGYENHVIFLVSHADILDQAPQEKQKALKQLYQSLQQKKFKQKLILYSNKNSNFSDIANILYNQGCKIQPKRIQIEDQIYYQYFPMSNINIFDEDIQDYVKKIQYIAECYNQFGRTELKTYRGTQQIDDLISDLRTSLRLELTQEQKRQYQQYQNIIGAQRSGNLYIHISQQIQSKLYEFQSITQAYLNKTYFYQAENKNYDIRDMFKKCPNCEIIWMRAEGCDGQTNCGNKPSWFDYFKTKHIWKYTIKRNGKKLSVKGNQLKKKEEKQLEHIASKKSNPAGCGRPLVWRELKRLSNIEDIVKQLYGVVEFEQIKKDIQKVQHTIQESEQELKQKLSASKLRISQSLLP